MMNITKTLNDFLLENVLTDYSSVIYNDLFPNDDEECLVSRYDPSQAKETEYIDGSAVGSWSIAYYYRNSDAETSRTTLLTIANALDNLKLTDSDGTKIDVEAQTLPSFVSVDDKNLVIYTIEIICRYMRPAKL